MINLELGLKWGLRFGIEMGIAIWDWGWEWLMLELFNGDKREMIDEIDDGKGWDGMKMVE